VSTRLSKLQKGDPVDWTDCKWRFMWRPLSVRTEAENTCPGSSALNTYTYLYIQPYIFPLTRAYRRL